MTISKDFGAILESDGCTINPGDVFYCYKLCEVPMSTQDGKRIGNICNYYGGISVKTDNLKYYWSIKDYTGYDWQEIPESLYKALIEYENTRIKIKNYTNDEQENNQWVTFSKIELKKNNETI